MKIKHTDITIVTTKLSYARIRLWLDLPDVYTMFYGMGETDREYLKLCWDNNDFDSVDRLLSMFPFSMCKGCVIICSRLNLRNKRFSWFRFAKHLTFITTELNTPVPEDDDKPGIDIKNPESFLKYIGIGGETPRSLFGGLVNYATLYLLNKLNDRS